MKCKICHIKVRSAEYETGKEDYCNCQSTLDYDFDPKLWVKEK